MSTATKALYALITLVTLISLSCSTPPNDVVITFVDKHEAVTAAGFDAPLKLMVEVEGGGKLILNGIETGNVADTSLLGERLRTVFEDREKASIFEREVVIEMNGPIRRDDLERLISTLSKAQASSIRVTSSIGR